MAIVLALVAAVLYGVSDYVGGRASRIVPAVSITFVAELSMLAGVLVALPVLGDPFTSVADLGWGALAGLAGTVGVISLYHALSVGVMTVVAPITAVTAAALPVVVGLALGERPGPVALLGVGVAVVAIALVSGAVGVPHVPTPTRLVLVALLAGAAFGSLFVFYSRAGDDSGLWPLLGARITSLPAMSFLVWHRTRSGRAGSRLAPLDAGASVHAGRRSGVVPSRAVLPGIAIGALTLGANVSYLVSTRRGLLSIVAVVVSLYPASTVLLATWIDGERLRRPQVAGLALTGGALVLVTLGR